MSVKDIRKALLDAGYTEEQINNIKGKKQLLRELATINTNLELVEYDPNTCADNTTNNEPEYGSPEWSDYVLTLFKPTELFNGSPNCYGLRRVAQLLLGDIINSKPISVIPNNGGSTVMFEVQFLWKREICVPVDLTNPAPYIYKTFGDVADCSPENTPRPYSLHPSATAASRAEARCLRKALLLNVLSAEELTHNQSDYDMQGNLDSDYITDTQKVFLKTKCTQLGIDLNKFLAQNSNCPLDKIDRAKAVEMIVLLNRYQYDSNHKEHEEIPLAIKL